MNRTRDTAKNTRKPEPGKTDYGIRGGQRHITTSNRVPRQFNELDHDSVAVPVAAKVKDPPQGGKAKTSRSSYSTDESRGIGWIVGGVFVLIVLGYIVFGVVVSEHSWYAVEKVEKIEKIESIGLEKPSSCEVIAKRYSSSCESVEFFPTTFKDGELSCGFNLWSDTTYLPDPEMYECLSKNKPIEWGIDSESFRYTIDKLQFPENCDSPYSSDFTQPNWKPAKDKKGEDSRTRGSEKFDPHSPKWNLLTFMNHGFAYNFYVFAWNAVNHWESKIPVIVGNSNYRFTDNKCGRGWNCAFSKLSSCSIEEIDPKKILVFSSGVSARNVMSVDQLCKPHGKYSIKYGRCICHDKYITSMDADYTYCKPYSAFDLSITRKRLHIESYETNKTEAVMFTEDVWFGNQAPGEQNPHNTNHDIHFRTSSMRTKYGWLWQHAQSTYWLLKNSQLKTELELYRSKLGIHKGKCLAVHVRHGDSCEDSAQTHRECYPFSTYVQHMRTLTLTYGKYSTVYLATDDPDIIKEANAYKSEFNIVFQTIDRSFYVHEGENGVDGLTSYNEVDKIMEIVRDIWAMSHCHAMVGSMTSSVMWVAYEMMVAKHGHYAPFISIDLPYGHHRNVGRYTTAPNV